MTDKEVTPRSRHREKIIKEDAKVKDQLKVTDRWIEVSGKKILEKFRKNNGSVYSRYIGQTDDKQGKGKNFLKENQDQIRQRKII